MFFICDRFHHYEPREQDLKEIKFDEEKRILFLPKEEARNLSAQEVQVPGFDKDRCRFFTTSIEEARLVQYTYHMGNVDGSQSASRDFFLGALEIIRRETGEKGIRENEFLIQKMEEFVEQTDSWHRDRLPGQ